MKFMTTVKGDVREYKFLLSPRGYGFQVEMAKRGTYLRNASHRSQPELHTTFTSGRKVYEFI